MGFMDQLKDGSEEKCETIFKPAARKFCTFLQKYWLLICASITATFAILNYFHPFR